MEWTESHYNEGWGGLKSIFKGSHTVPYGKGALDISTVTSIASPSVSIDSIPYAFVVSLDHRLRIWNLSTGRIAYVGDILNQELDPNDARKQVIDPSHSQLVKVLGDEENVICVTYSPLGTGQFKFWNVFPTEEGNLEVIDAFPHNTLEPRAPTSDLWTLADFSVVLDRSNLDSHTLWALWKNNTTYRVQKLDFQGGSIARVRDAWTSGWVAMARRDSSGDASASSISWRCCRCNRQVAGSYHGSREVHSSNNRDGACHL